MEDLSNRFPEREASGLSGPSPGWEVKVFQN